MFLGFSLIFFPKYVNSFYGYLNYTSLLNH